MMLYPRPWFWISATLLSTHGALVIGAASASSPSSELWSALEDPQPVPAVEVQLPVGGALMPQNVPSPVLLWNTNLPGCASWAAVFKTGARTWVFDPVQPMWHPDDSAWREIKEAAGTNQLRLTIAGRDGSSTRRIRTRASLSFMIDSVPVNAPLFYREVNLPFSEAVKDP